MTINPGSKSTIRPLDPNDLEAVISIDSQLSGFERRGFFQKRLASAIERPKEYVYTGLDENGVLIGFAMARLTDGEFGQPGARATLDALGVQQGHQNHGAGHVLLDEVKAVLRHKGVTELDSEVDWENRSLLNFFGDTGFSIAPSIILRRSTEEMKIDYETAEDDEDILEIDHSSPDGDQSDALSQDRIPVRSMDRSDLDAIIRIDAKLSGAERQTFFQRKARENLDEAGVRVSLVAEMDGYPVGFIMARVDFGAFGRTIKTAVMDVFGVDPGYQGQGIGHVLMSKLIANLGILQVEDLRTEVEWSDTALIHYFSSVGFVPAQRMKLAVAL